MHDIVIFSYLSQLGNKVFAYGRLFTAQWTGHNTAYTVSPVIVDFDFESEDDCVFPSLQFVCSGHVKTWETYFEREETYSNIKFH